MQNYDYIAGNKDQVVQEPTDIRGRSWWWIRSMSLWCWILGRTKEYGSGANCW